MKGSENRRATLIGVVAAAFLTAIKLFAGILSNSLAILAEAAHSALDLTSAGTGFIAIRISEKGPDREHMYGHHKVDSIGGFIAALLLLITCAWILYEGIDRLIFRVAELDIGLLAFSVMIVSVVVDINRTYVFRRAAKRTGSTTMRANYLHFASDIASSTAVFVGLIFVAMGYLTVDSLLAIGIAVYFGIMSIRLTRGSAMELLDTVPADLSREIEELVRQVEGVTSSEHVRARKMGKELFIDLVIDVDPRKSFLASHEIASRVEKVIHRRYKESDVVVHVNPTSASEGIIKTIRDIALSKGAEGAHAVDLESFGESLNVSLHLEFSPTTSLGEAHKIASNIEREIKELKGVAKVVTHIEPEESEEGVTKIESASMVDVIRQIATKEKGVESCHDILLARVGKEYHITMHCTFDEKLTVHRVHDITTDLEEKVKRELRDVVELVIHEEPRSPKE